MVGSVLLVAVTVMMATAFGILVLSRPGPVDLTRPDLLILVNPGPDGSWDTSDENASITHLGGEAIPRLGTRITIDGGDPTRTFQEGSLGLPFTGAEDSLLIGRTWYAPQPVRINQGQTIVVNIIAERGDATVVIGSATITAGATA